MADLLRVNLDELVPHHDEADPEGHRAGMARFGPAIGATQTGATLYEPPPGQSICPSSYAAAGSSTAGRARRARKAADSRS